MTNGHCVNCGWDEERACLGDRFAQQIDPSIVDTCVADAAGSKKLHDAILAIASSSV
jgi:hypothetical protein